MSKEYRAYFLSMYQLKGIQAGIQSLHAIVEYQLKYPEDVNYIEWAKNHKTVIVLDGGTSWMQVEHAKFLEEIGHPHAVFHEPDLNNSISAISFIVDNTIYDDKKYPFNEDFLFLDEEGIKDEWHRLYERDKATYSLIGYKGIKLREFIKKFRLASN